MNIFGALEFKESSHEQFEAKRQYLCCAIKLDFL